MVEAAILTCRWLGQESRRFLPGVVADQKCDTGLDAVEMLIRSLQSLMQYLDAYTLADLLPPDAAADKSYVRIAPPTGPYRRNSVVANKTP